MLTAWLLRLKIIPDDIINTKVKENMPIGHLRTPALSKL